MSEATPLGTPSADEMNRRVEAAIHAKLEMIAQRHEQKVLEGVADIVARYDQPDRSMVPEFQNRNGETVHRLTSPWDPYYRRLTGDEAKIRNAHSDHWMREWLRGVQQQDFAGRVQAEAKLEAMFPDLYRADTLEGAANASGGFAGGTGGVLIPRPLESLVAIALAKIAKMARWARLYTMTQQEHNIPTAGAATAYMQGEATTPLTGGEPSLAQKPLIAYDAIGKLVLGRNLIDDEAANVVPVFVQLMGDALGELEDSEFLKAGTGSSPHVTKLAGVAFSETTSGILSYTNVLGMYSSVPQRYRSNARWLVNGTVLQLLANVRDGFGRPFYQSLVDPPVSIGDDENGGPDGSRVGTLLGKPVHEVDLTAGDIYFGDVFRNYAIGRRRGITVEFSKDFYFDTRRVIYLVTERIAGNNIDTSAGQLCSGITSANSL